MQKKKKKRSTNHMSYMTIFTCDDIWDATFLIFVHDAFSFVVLLNQENKCFSLLDTEDKNPKNIKMRNTFLVLRKRYN